MGLPPIQHRSACSRSLPRKTAKPPIGGELLCADRTLNNVFARFSDILRENSLTGLGYPESNLSHQRTSCLTIINDFEEKSNTFEKICIMKFNELFVPLLYIFHKYPVVPRYSRPKRLASCIRRPSNLGLSVSWVSSMQGVQGRSPCTKETPAGGVGGGLERPDARRKPQEALREFPCVANTNLV